MAIGDSERGGTEGRAHNGNALPSSSEAMLPPPSVSGTGNGRGQPSSGYPLPDAPPSYEQSLQHPTIPFNGAAGILDYGADGGAYPGPPPNVLPGSTDIPSAYSFNHRGRVGAIRPDLTDTESVDSETEAKANHCIRMTLPPMHICMAITCLIFNFVIPGLGTMLAGFGVFCCTKRDAFTCKDRVVACCLNLALGLAQLLTTPLLLLGWIWSILWGFAFVGVSYDDYHGLKRERRGQPPSYSASILPRSNSNRLDPEAPETYNSRRARPVLHVTELDECVTSAREHNANGRRASSDTERSRTISQNSVSSLDADSSDLSTSCDAEGNPQRSSSVSVMAANTTSPRRRATSVEERSRTISQNEADSSVSSLDADSSDWSTSSDAEGNPQRSSSVPVMAANTTSPPKANSSLVHVSS